MEIEFWGARKNSNKENFKSKYFPLVNQIKFGGFLFFYNSEANHQRRENNSQVISKVSVLNSLYEATIIWLSKLEKGKPIMQIDRAMSTMNTVTFLHILCLNF